MACMENDSAGTGGKPESMLEVRVELVDIEPKIWRQLEVRASLTLDRVHQVLQTAFGWEDMHLHRFTANDPFAPLRPVNGGIPETLQWLPRQECDEPDDRPDLRTAPPCTVTKLGQKPSAQEKSLLQLD